MLRRLIKTAGDNRVGIISDFFRSCFDLFDRDLHYIFEQIFLVLRRRIAGYSRSETRKRCRKDMQIASK